MTARIVVVGSLMMDLVLRVPRRPAAGETVFGMSFGMYLGGKGFNQAVAARRLGANVAMIGRVGADAFGDSLCSALAREQINAVGVQADEAEGTGVAVPVIDAAGENSIIAVPRANMRLTPAHIEAAWSAVGAAQIVLMQMETPSDALMAAATLARAAGALVLLNVAPAGDVPEPLLRAADYIIANEHEAHALTGRAVCDIASASDAVVRLRGWARRGAVVTLGPLGAVAVTEGEPIHAPAYPAIVVDTTGAGDTFCAAFAGRLAAGAAIADALRWANAAGACAVSRLGAEPSLPTYQEVQARIETGARIG